jgi:hypothetical protein
MARREGRLLARLMGQLHITPDTFQVPRAAYAETITFAESAEARMVEGPQ